jgi:SAM-dependent methyltransferase
MMTTTSAQVPSARETYEAFAPYYDAFTASSDYEAWTGHVLELAARLGLAGNTMLDLACGTGKSFLPFLERGFEVTAADLSPAMLSEAAAKAPDVAVFEADVRALPDFGQFDLVTCFDDSLNYLLDEAELGAALRSIAASVRPDGVALFDLNTLLAYRTTFAADSVVDRDDTLLVWRGESAMDAAPGCRAAARIDVFVLQDGGLYERLTTHHVQRHFPSERVLALIAAAGLECLGVYGVLDDGRLVPEADESQQLKVLYAARPTKGGDAK